MSEQEQLMDDLLNIDLEIIDVVRVLQQENWNSESSKQKIEDLLKIRDEMVEKLMSSNTDEYQCGCGHGHSHD